MLEQFVPSSKEKLVNDQCFESGMGDMYKQTYQIKERHEKLR